MSSRWQLGRHSTVMIPQLTQAMRVSSIQPLLASIARRSQNLGYRNFSHSWTSSDKLFAKLAQLQRGVEALVCRRRTPTAKKANSPYRSHLLI